MAKPTEKKHRVLPPTAVSRSADSKTAKPSRMMGILVVDVLAARTVEPPAPPKKVERKQRATG